MQTGILNWLAIGQAGTMRLDVPVYTLGNGRPVLAVTCCVHGDETAGLFAVSQMIHHLRLCNALNGTIHIIPSANPAAQFASRRVASLDQKDLNRVGRGRKEGSYTERIGARLFDFLSQCDLVINLHEFEMRTPITAVFMNAGKVDIRTRTLAAIKAFAPEMIWVINTSQTADVKYESSLDTALAQAGVVNFPVETGQLAFLTDEEIKATAQGLLRAAAYLGILTAMPETARVMAPAFTRQEITADEGGLWEPEAKLMQPVQAGEVIGMLRGLPDFQDKQVHSPSAGMLVQYRHRQLVATGSSLFSIGQSADDIIAAYA